MHIWICANEIKVRQKIDPVVNYEGVQIARTDMYLWRKYDVTHGVAEYKDRKQEKWQKTDLVEYNNSVYTY